MIYFVTNHKETFDYYDTRDFINITVLEDNQETFSFYKNWAAKKYYEDNAIAGFDKETNGLDSYINVTLMDIIGDRDNQFVFHTPYCSFKKYLYYIRRKFLILGHNIKFDIKFALVEHNLRLLNIYDTMIAEQRIYMKSGFRYSLEALLIRYKDTYPQSADKNIREEFIGCDVTKFKILPRHIYYAAGDVEHLEDIRDKQTTYIEKYNQHFLLYGIEFPLIYIIALAEITGWDFNTKKWLEIYEKNIKDRFELELKLDEEVRRLRDKYCPDKKYMTGGKWDNIRKHNPIYDTFNADGTTKVLNLFGEPMRVNTLIGSKAKETKKIQKFPNNINYESDIQIVEIFARLNEPVLTKKEQLIVPTFTKTGKINRLVHSFTTGEDAFTMYKHMLPESIMIPFIDLLLKHRMLSTAINTFGANVITKINPVTNKLHTIFRQIANTGRMKSGGGSKEPDKINSQNIPSKAPWAIDMRNCFIAPPGYSIGTHDYTGAELIMMCSISQDMRLLEISKQDIHSYVAQAFWRNIYKYRAHILIAKHKQLEAEKGKELADKHFLEDIQENIKLGKSYIVDKKTGGGKIRTDAKPLTFGTIYGMYAAKAGKAAKVAKEEGQIIINTIKSLFPKVFRMVEDASSFARSHGYLILNSRTNSRMWFPTIIKALRGIINPKDFFIQIQKEMSEARNGKIQGSQADFVKEASVDIQTYIDENNLDIVILKWVHDEIVDKHPKYLDGKSKEWKDWIKENPKGLSFTTDDEVEHTGLSFPEVKRLIMINTAERYLNNVTIDVDYSVEPFWTK